MNSEYMKRLHNCSASVLQRVSLLDVNTSQLEHVLGEVMRTSAKREVELIRENLSDCIFWDQNPPFDLLWWQKLSWSLIFAGMLLIAIGGNTIVMWIVLAHRRMRTVTNYFLVNLSLADLMMSVLNCVFNFIFMLNSNWPFGILYCTVSNFVANVTVASSVLTLVAISFDRYMAIIRPLKHRMSRRRARLAVALIWFASALLALPCLLYSTTITRRYSGGRTRTICYIMWPDGRYPESTMDYIYNLVFLGVTYVIPVMVMAVCYFIMGRELWGSRSIGEHTQRQKESMKSKRKVVRMFTIVVTIFAVCWLPYHGFFIFAHHYRSFAETSSAQHIYLAFYWLAMSNAMVNPIIYYWMNNRFRVYFQQIICECCCMSPRSDTQGGQMQGLTGLHPSDLTQSRSGHQLKSASIRWSRSTAESHVRIMDMNKRLICDEVHHKENSVIISSGPTKSSSIILSRQASHMSP